MLRFDWDIRGSSSKRYIFKVENEIAFGRQYRERIKLKIKAVHSRLL